MSDIINSNFDSFFSGNGTRSNSPAVNIQEDDKNYSIELALPGIIKEDIKIEIENDLINISSEIEQGKKEEKEAYTVKEFGTYSFCKSFKLPENVKTDKISAEYTNGILRVGLPKSAETKVQKTIKIS